MARIIVTIFLICPLLTAAPPARFQQHTVTNQLKGGYHVVTADVNRDGRLDLIALADGMPDLVWYENPTWTRHVIAGGFERMIHMAVSDFDGDGALEILLAHEFSMNPQKSAGIISLLTQQKNSPKEPWTVKEIDRLPTSHRLRLADVDGTGRKIVINAPLAGAKAVPPQYKDKVPLSIYRPGVWGRVVISNDIEGILHGIEVLDWNNDKREDVLTASYLGIDLFLRGRDGWERVHLADGNPDEWPNGGSSEITVGRLGRRRFLAAVEPWHGSQAVVYTQEDGSTWFRRVIDDSLVQGHALITADLNADGRDEIIAGFRGKGTSVFIYSAESNRGDDWVRRTLDDGGMAAASCTVADINGDGRSDIVCIGGTTLKWYENIGNFE